AVIGEYVCSGYLWAANVGWISLGSGSPANGIRYQNNSATDWGVNHDGLGNLRGYAYGANIGWIAFETNGAPKIDLVTGKLSGHVWSANCGWISLSNAQAHVQTAYLAPGADSDGDGIADGWELTYTNTLGAFTATSDTDRDRMTDKQEYLAGTNPLDPNDALRITYYSRTGTNNTMQWTSVPTRFYRVQRATGMSNTPSWHEPALGIEHVLGCNSASFPDPTTNAFYRVRAVRPLMQ
ncbi:MAG: thrombospondin type 3 repeat-containing protein, partial [Verrucomicrobiae bacterium]|nr:thrombospondin type 3 repeat-containing protein [Verrucomicrobiae bacterium]